MTSALEYVLRYLYPDPDKARPDEDLWPTEAARSAGAQALAAAVPASAWAVVDEQPAGLPVLRPRAGTVWFDPADDGVAWLVHRLPHAFDPYRAGDPFAKRGGFPTVRRDNGPHVVLRAPLGPGQADALRAPVPAWAWAPGTDYDGRYLVDLDLCTSEADAVARCRALSVPPQDVEVDRSRRPVHVRVTFGDNGFVVWDDGAVERPPLFGHVCARWNTTPPASLSEAAVDALSMRGPGSTADVARITTLAVLGDRRPVADTGLPCGRSGTGVELARYDGADADGAPVVLWLVEEVSVSIGEDADVQFGRALFDDEAEARARYRALAEPARPARPEPTDEARPCWECGRETPHSEVLRNPLAVWDGDNPLMPGTCYCGC